MILMAFFMLVIFSERQYHVLSADPSSLEEIVKHYDVVKPIQLHESRQRRDISTKTKHGHLPKTRFAFEAKGKVFVLDVYLNSHLFHKDYTEWYQHPSGNFTKVENPENCFYHGNLANQPNSTVALNTCEGLSGVIYDEDGSSYGLDPMQRSSQTKDTLDNHIFYNLADLPVKRGKCGIKDSLHQIDTEELLRHKHIRFRRATSQSKETRYITFMLVNDKRQCDRFGGNVTSTNLWAKTVANLVDLAYKTINVRLALTTIETWNDFDKINVTTSPYATSAEFEKYDGDILKIKRGLRHDNAHLLTGIDFDGDIVGMAGLGTMCGMSSSGVDMVQKSNPMISANTVIHEMGHNLGMLHDAGGCVCSKSPCAMAASISGSQVQGFTDCSLGYLEKRINEGLGSCMFDVPAKLWGTPVCGNGFLEEGEECDCGTEAECLASNGSLCCNATLCTLNSNAQCAVGLCCSNCTFTSQGTSCRTNSTECDLPEYCTGKSAMCPANFYKQDGIACSNNTAYCFEGGCQTYDEQCTVLWGSGAKKAYVGCFNTNTEGGEFGNCGKDDAGKYVKCEQADVQCGKLQCQGMSGHRPIIGSNRASKTTSNWIGSHWFQCRVGSTFLGLDAKDPTIAAQGTKCDDGKLCYKHSCTNITSLDFIKQCDPVCENGGVCNNLGHCHCLSGWECPTCTSRYNGPGGSVDSGLFCGNVICPLGYEVTSDGEKCMACETGSYRGNDSGLRCIQCPGQKTTKESGARSSSSCIDILDSFVQDLEIQMIGETWSTQLTIAKSLEFRALAAKVSVAIVEVYKDQPLFLSVKVTSFRKGSIIADTVLYFDKALNDPLLVIREAIRNGSVGGLSVNSSQVLPVNYADYCTNAKPCELGKGDCDQDTQCKGDLVCGKDNCKLGEHKSTYDCCIKPSGLSSLAKILMIVFLGVLPLLIIVAVLVFKFRRSLCKNSSASISKSSGPASQSTPGAQQYSQKTDYSSGSKKTSFVNLSYTKK